MHRRHFMRATGLLAAAGAGVSGLTGLGSAEAIPQPDAEPGQATASPGAPGFIELRIYRLAIGPEGGRLAHFLSNAAPLFQRHGFGPIGYFNLSIGPLTPTLVQVLAYRTLGERMHLWDALDADNDWTSAVNALTSAGPAYDDLEVRLLRTLSIQPPWQPVSGHQIYELRVYRSPTVRQLKVLVERFTGGEVDVFHRAGFFPIFYTTSIAGPEMPNLTYLIPFESMAQRDEAWKRFGADPQWKQLETESRRKGGEVVQKISNWILSPAQFSAFR
jgi:hypothetical protein